MDEDLTSRPHNDQEDCDDDYLHWKPDDVNRLDDDLSISQAVSRTIDAERELHQPSDTRESLPRDIAASSAVSETSFAEPESSGILVLSHWQEDE